jgi:transcriptional regulator with XRE-family HTH domain
MRVTAGLSGNELARRMGITQSRVWKIENKDKATQRSLLPNEDDIQGWARETGNEQETDSLMEALAEARGEQSFSVVIRERGGAAFEDRVGRAEEAATRIGEFSVAVIPGILQTADYTRELLGVPAGLATWDSRDGAIEEKVSARLRRQEALLDPGKRVQVVISEAALRTLVVSAPVLAAQLGKLLSVLRLPSVELGVIGFGQRMPVYPYGFRLLDEAMAVTESTVAEREYTADGEPDDLAAFIEAFNELRQAASTGDAAEAIILRALADLRAG